MRAHKQAIQLLSCLHLKQQTLKCCKQSLLLNMPVQPGACQNGPAPPSQRVRALSLTGSIPALQACSMREPGARGLAPASQVAL